MKSLIASILLVSSAAYADDVTQHKGLVGADFELLPSGSGDLTLGGNGGSLGGSGSMDTAYGVGLTFENQIDELFSIGLAPRFLFNVNGKNSSTDASTEMDLRARVAVGHDLIPKLRLYGFGEPGYSVIFPASNGNGDTVHPNGFVIAAGGGLSFELSTKVRATFEMGYQWGFQSWSGTVFGQPVSGSADTSYFGLGFGLATTID
jgi:hypothetical protein